MERSHRLPIQQERCSPTKFKTSCTETHRPFLVRHYTNQELSGLLQPLGWLLEMLPRNVRLVDDHHALGATRSKIFIIDTAHVTDVRIIPPIIPDQVLRKWQLPASALRG